MADAKPDSLAGKKHVYMHEKIETLRATLRETLHDLDAMRAERDERDEARIRLSEWEDDVRATMREDCSSKERHCTCVPPLRRVAAAQKFRAEKAESGRDRLRSALEFYAKPERYDRFCDDDTGQTSSPSETEGDRGDVARAALNHDNEGTTP